MTSLLFLSTTILAFAVHTIGKRSDQMKDLCAGLLDKLPDERIEWVQYVKRHPELKNDYWYLQGFGGTAQEAQFQIDTMDQILKHYDLHNNSNGI